MVFEKDLSEIVAGEDEIYSLNFTINGSNRDVSNYEFEMEIKQNGRENIVLDGSNIDSSEAKDGKIVINLPSEQSQKLKEGRPEYIIRAVDQNDKNRAIVKGRLPVEVV